MFMKIFAIKDESDDSGNALAWLIYYEKEKRFYIELPDDADPWETPLILSSVLKRGERTANAYWSELWVRQRIVPPDRQNLGCILKDNNLESYDEFDLLMLAKGRCSQDNYYLESVSESNLPGSIIQRFQKKVEDVVPLSIGKLLVFFRNGTVKKCNILEELENNVSFSPLLNNADLFRTVSVQPGGYGVCWGENLVISDQILYKSGLLVPLSLEDFRSFVENRVINTAEAAEILDCSRQNIEDLVRRDKLHPLKSSPKNKLFLKSELLQRKWL